MDGLSRSAMAPDDTLIRKRQSVFSLSTRSSVDYYGLLTKCGGPLLRAMSDRRGLHEFVCLMKCGMDDIACQMRCGDLYEEDVLKEFHICAISEHQVIPQRIDRHAAEGRVRDDQGKSEQVARQLPGASEVDRRIPVVAALEPAALQGEWWVVYGLNPVFDCFPCQHHTASVVKSAPGKTSEAVRSDDGAPHPIMRWKNGAWTAANGVRFDISYRVPVPHGGDKQPFFTRHVEQVFFPHRSSPGVLRSHDPTYLHQSDDWYILSADPERYFIVYYMGCNDAWCGYDGGVVYSRTPEPSQATIDDVREALRCAGLSIVSMCPVDNACSLQSPLADRQ
ncbi:unnamed protein product [Vitrella brassicaformis CCMP3155]|uniref:VDE lipocalin domain-containing protein n=1 Tax=Vitrella brassicaformis (strain CCMP3155) TaxID=1169540 RepID=A0A0G4GWM3_VITBC|nr:unnamed protein product [Vitrella brassicaformis CCMP3155]|eukprot:CEM35152.1 unnamed protein product [Vitrella brassicaformis CCMP3155]